MRGFFFIFWTVFIGLLLAAPMARADELDRAVSEWKILSDEDQTFSFARYAAFLDRHDDFPRTRMMRAAAERAMPAGITPAQVLAFFRADDPVTANGMRAYLRAAAQTGRTHAAYQTLKSWYVQAFMNAEDQAAFLDEYRAVLFPHAARARFDHLVETDQMERAAAMADLIGGDYPNLARALAAGSGGRGGAGLSPALRFYPALVAARLKAYRMDDRTDRAADYFLSIPLLSTMTGPQQDMAAEQQNLVYDLLDAGRAIDAYRVASHVTYTDNEAAAQALWMSGYVAMDHLHQPGRAFRAFEKLYAMATSPLTRARAAYYAGRASESLGYPEVARAWTRAAAGYNANFYGQMAKEVLAARGADQDIPVFGPPVATDRDRIRFEQRDVVRAARRLARAGDKQNARLFLTKLADGAEGDGDQLRLVVDAARSMGDVPAAVKISRLAAKKGVDFGDYMYPVVRAVAPLPSGIEPALIYAIIRQESGFDAGAVSPAGAKGLMQLMPTTAAEVAGRADLRHSASWLTTRPDHNVRLGAAYIARLVARYDGSYALAAAAYNAGPSRVNDWIERFGDPRTGEISVAAWTERIPFSETRNYVQRVLEGTAVYRQILKGPRADTNLDALHLRK